MTLQDIHDMSADALAGEELQLRHNGDWVPAPADHPNLFHPDCHWRIKPTIEVNGVMMSKRQAKAAWEASGATSYESMGSYITGSPAFKQGACYIWKEPKWIYVNGEKIVRYGGDTMYMGYPVADHAEGVKISKALKALIEIK